MITRKDVRMDNYAYPASEPIFKELKILKLKDIHKLFICKFVYKWTQGQLPSNFNHWFMYTSQVHQHFTRRNYTDGIDNKLLYIPFGRTTNYGCKKLKVLAPVLWNIIPLEIKLKPTVQQFTNNFKKYVLDSYLSM